MNALINELKSAKQDFEFYPTTVDMLHSIYCRLPDKEPLTVLDIGAGNGGFKKHLLAYSQEINLKKYMVIEKSPILLNQLDSDTQIIGADFYQTTLLDKKADIIFCNPPYSDYENWVTRILSQAIAKEFYFIIPERWKDNNNIKHVLEQFKITPQVIHSSDFLDAERQARAKVDVVSFISPYRKDENAKFSAWFNKIFPFTNPEPQEQESLEKLKGLVLSKDLIETLLNLYDKELEKISNNYTSLSKLDPFLFKELHISIPMLQQTLKDRLAETKTTYWNLLFNNLGRINTKLTHSSRKKLLDVINENNHVDFNKDNISAVLMYVLKNATDYYNNQITNLFKLLSAPENIKKYKSNAKVFDKDKWRWHQDEPTHYTLDYRIVTENYKVSKSKYSYSEWEAHEIVLNNIKDIVTVANNLGFNSGFEPADPRKVFIYGEKQYIYQANGKQLLEFKIFQNGNIHYKFDLDFCKALNVEAARLLGWIKSKADVEKEFDDSLKDASKYYGVSIPANNLLTFGEVKKD